MYGLTVRLIDPLLALGNGMASTPFTLGNHIAAIELEAQSLLFLWGAGPFHMSPNA